MLNEEITAVPNDIKQNNIKGKMKTQPSVPARSREAVSVFKMPDMQTSQRCRPKGKDLDWPLDASKPQKKNAR